MMIKIVATIHDAGQAAHIGGDVESISQIINIPTENIPPILKKYIEDRQKAKTKKNYWIYRTVTFSLLEE